MFNKIIPVAPNVGVANALIMEMMIRKFPDEVELRKVISKTIDTAFDLVEAENIGIVSYEQYKDLIDTRTYQLYWLIINQKEDEK
jgi:hypothetical protein